MAVTSEEERGPSEELTKAFGRIVLKDNKSLNNQAGENGEPNQQKLREPLFPGDPGNDLNIENLEI